MSASERPDYPPFKTNGYEFMSESIVRALANYPRPQGGPSAVQKLQAPKMKNISN